MRKPTGTGGLPGNLIGSRYDRVLTVKKNAQGDPYYWVPGATTLAIPSVSGGTNVLAETPVSGELGPLATLGVPTISGEGPSCVVE